MLVFRSALATVATMDRMNDVMGTAGFQQNSSDFGELMRARRMLDEAMAQDASGEESAWLRRVQLAAQALYQAVEQHEELAEEEGGTLADATVGKPGLMPVRQRLEHEHADMLHRLSEIDLEAERQMALQDFNVEFVRLQVQVVRDILLLHLARTDSLLFDAYIRVEGGEGG
jgi:hypothetical protein